MASKDRRAIAAVIACAVGGLWLRVEAARTMGSHLDEGASVLALDQLAAGSVRLPSGTPYLQGFTLSVLALPLRWAGSGQIDDLFALRLVSCLVGAAAIVLVGALTWTLTGRAWCSALAALLLAIDPTSIQWSGFFRMYALLQAMTVAMVLVTVLVAQHGSSVNRGALLVTLCWAAVFTQIQAAIVVVSLVAGILLLAVRSERGARRSLLVVAASMSAAPVVLVLANRVLGGGTSGADAGAGGASFVGGNWIVVDSWSTRSWSTWWTVVAGGPGGVVVAVAVSVASAILVVHAWRTADLGEGILLVTHWFGVACVSLLVASTVPRYVLFVVPMSFAVVAVAGGRATEMIDDRWSLPPWTGPTAVAVAALGAALVAVPVRHEHHWSESPDMVFAAREVAKRRSPGQRTLVTLPPAPGLVLGFDSVLFLSGRVDGDRYRLYTRPGPMGGRTDFWLGVPVVASSVELCHALLAPEGAWVIAPDKYLADPTWFTPEQREVIDRLTVDAGGIDYFTRLRRTGGITAADRARCRALGWRP